MNNEEREAYDLTVENHERAMARVAELEREVERQTNNCLNLQQQVEDMKAQPGGVVYQLQCREIGEGDWCPADLRHYTYCQQSPEMDTRIVEVQKAAALNQPASVEAVEVVGWLGGNGLHAERNDATGAPFDLMTVAQHKRILDATVPAGCKVVPVELLGRAARHLNDWLELDQCECEGPHYCGRTQVVATNRQLRAILEVKDERG